MTTIDFHTFAIRVVPSPATNDHEVRLLGDGEDLIDRFWGDLMGLDPDDILREPSPLSASRAPHLATVARCDCGVIGCGSAAVTVRSEGDHVHWVERERTLRFPAPQYAAELRRAQADTSWETPDRTAARLVGERIDRTALAAQGLTFEWASGRVEEKSFTLSLRLEPGPYQVLASVPWTSETPEQLADAALRMLQADPRSWKHVSYLPQRRGLGAPAMRGRGWTQG